jgi:[ribosomal protein S18]-alanine N-acetyltransferase
MPCEDGHLSLLSASAAAAGEMAQLHAELFEPAWDAPSFAKLLAHPAALALQARSPAQQELAGFILGLVAADEAEIITLAVRACRQRQGIATRLIEALARSACTAGAGCLRLEVDAGNTAALALYRQRGFLETGRRVAYYTKHNAAAADAVTFRRPL